MKTSWIISIALLVAMSGCATTAANDDEVVDQSQVSDPYDDPYNDPSYRRPGVNVGVGIGSWGGRSGGGIGIGLGF